ncbi:hypothetical protein D3C87_1408320 [compost metagenome]
MHQRPGNAHALFLPAGQLRRVSLVLGLQAHQFQQFTDLLLPLFLGYAGDFQRQLDVLPNGLGRHQVEVLEDHADAPTQRHQAVFVELADVHLIDQYPTAARLFEAIDGADQRRLAGAAAADDAEHFAALDRQVDAVQRGHRSLLAVVGFTQIDEAHMSTIELGMQLRLCSFCRLWKLQSPLDGGDHVQLSQPA